MSSDLAASGETVPRPPLGRAESSTRVFRKFVGDIFAGSVIATSNLALAVSFAAAIFQGELAEGFSTGVWIMLISMIVVGLVVGFFTTLQPIAGGPDTAVIAVIGLMAPAVAGPVLAIGLSKQDALVHVMLGMTLVAFASGLTLLILGLLRAGQSLRFVPYPLVAGFLAATGFLLVTFSLRIVIVGPADPTKIATLTSDGNGIRIAAMLGFAILLGSARVVLKSPLVTPLVYFGLAAALNWVLHAGFLGEIQNWYIATMHGLRPWLPFGAIQDTEINWSVYLWALPELATCVVVAVISLIVRVSTFESNRMAAANIDHELRIYGTASLLSGLAGGMTGGILFSTSKFMADSSAKTRFAYVVIAALLALTIFANFDLSRVVPTPILGGFLLLLGYAMVLEALKVTLRQKAVLEVLLTVAIMVVCLWFGFIVGVLAGFVAACLLFAFSYARIGIIRHHTTRSLLAGATERAHDIEAIIRRNGERIHVYELEGYVFFGSSEELFEQIRIRRRAQTDDPIRFIIIDFVRVTGHDSSAINTLNKLRGYCRKHDIALALSGLSESDRRNLIPAKGTTGQPEIHIFGGLIEALDWAEESLLESLDRVSPTAGTLEDFAKWISTETGALVTSDVASSYFKCVQLSVGEQLYGQGEQADTIDFVIVGTVAMMLETRSGETHCVRRSSRQTVLGEMGFFRKAARNVSIIAERPATIYSLERTDFEALKAAHPDVHDGILNFVIRILSDRLELATIELSATR